MINKILNWFRSNRIASKGFDCSCRKDYGMWALPGPLGWELYCTYCYSELHKKERENGNKESKDPESKEGAEEARSTA
jgi:hypothetical protein